MKNNKGFTLIELIGVIIIIALIILIVFPATVKLIKDNDKKKFDHYYDIILKGAELYANSRRDDLGGNDGNGCVDDVKLSDLIDGDYVKKFDEEEVVCGSPSEFAPTELENFGLSGEYVDIKISNDKGNISTEASLVCIKGRKLAYSNLIEKSGTCSKYVAEAENVLLDSISTLTATTEDNHTYYVNGSVNNNYVWYSGKMWRIVSFNKLDRSIKLVTDEAVSILSYDMENSNFLDSNINIWLNNDFLNTLKNPEVYLLDDTWNFSTVSDASMPPNTNVMNAKVGLLNYYEYNKIRGFLNIGQNWWLLSRASNVNAWNVSTSNSAVSSSSTTFMGVRPAIVLKPNITYISGGNGTANNPYRLSGDTSANVGALLNSRYVGEYVKFNDATYRISKVDNEYTRLISTNTVSVTQFHYHASNYSAMSTVGEYLNDSWVNSLTATNKSKLYVGDFCIMKLTPTISQTTLCPLSDIVNVLVGIPKLSDMFVTGTASGEYWTLSPIDDRTLNIVGTNGVITTKDIESYSGVRPVINIVSSAKIASGNGTVTSPYVIQ